MARPPEFTGTHFEIQALTLGDGSCPAGEFLDSLADRDRQKLDVLFEYLGNHGKLSNRQKFKKVENSDGIWEFKSHQIRILCFFAPGKKVLLALGVIKKRNKLDAADVRKAEVLKQHFSER